MDMEMSENNNENNNNEPAVEPVEPYYVRDAARRKAYSLGLKGSCRTWEALPREILEMIAGHCSHRSIVNSRLVCKRWDYHFSACCKEMRPRFGSMVHRLSAGEEFPEVRFLDLTRCRDIRNRQFIRLTKSKVPIKTLLMGSGMNLSPPHECHLTNKAFDSIHSMNSVTCLALVSMQNISGAALTSIFNMTQLTSLHLIRCNRFTSEDCSGITKLTNLQSLSLNKNKRMELSVVSRLSTLTTLQRLNLSGVAAQAVFSHPEAITQLETLELSDMEITRFQFHSIRSFPKLRKLALCLVIDPGLQLRPLVAMPPLECLNMGNVDFQNPWPYGQLWPFDLMSSLRGLKISLSVDTPANSLQRLSSLEQLTALTVDSSNAAIHALGGISALTNLVIAEFPATTLPVDLVEALVHLTRLEKLNLSGLRGTPSEMRQSMEFTLMPILAFAQLRRLRCLDLSFSTLKYPQAVTLVTRMLDAQTSNSQGQLEELILEDCLNQAELMDLRNQFPGIHFRDAGLFRLGGSTQFWDDDLTVT